MGKSAGKADDVRNILLSRCFRVRRVKAEQVLHLVICCTERILLTSRALDHRELAVNVRLYLQPALFHNGMAISELRTHLSEQRVLLFKIVPVEGPLSEVDQKADHLRCTCLNSRKGIHGTEVFDLVAAITQILQVSQLL